MRIVKFFVADDPGIPFAIGLPAMVFAAHIVPTMISGDDDHPILAEFCLSVLYRLPDLFDLLVKFADGIVLLGAVAIAMTHVIRILQINPREVNSLFPDGSSCISSNLIIDLADISCLLVMGIADGIQFMPV